MLDKSNFDEMLEFNVSNVEWQSNVNVYERDDAMMCFALRCVLSRCVSRFSTHCVSRSVKDRRVFTAAFNSMVGSETYASVFYLLNVGTLINYYGPKHKYFFLP